MKEKKVVILVKTLGVLGLLMIVISVALFNFTDIAKDSAGVMSLAVLIAVGMLFVIPAKLFLTFFFMKKHHESQVKAYQESLLKDEK